MKKIDEKVLFMFIKDALEQNLNVSQLGSELSKYLTSNNLSITQEDYDVCLEKVKNIYVKELNKRKSSLVEKPQEHKGVISNCILAVEEATAKIQAEEKVNIVLLGTKIQEATYLIPALQVLEYAFQLKYSIEKRNKALSEDCSDDEIERLDCKIQNIVEILAGNQKNIEVIINTYVLANLFSFLAVTVETSSIYKIISKTSFTGLKSLRKSLGSKKKQIELREMLAKTLVSCFTEQMEEFDTTNAILKGLELLKSFDVSHIKIGAKRVLGQELPSDIKLLGKEEDYIQSNADNFENAISSVPGGLNGYINQVKNILKAYEGLEVSKITGTDDMVLSDTVDIPLQISRMLSDVKSNIMSVYEKIFETPIMLGQIKGVFLFPDENSRGEEAGIITVKNVEGGEKGTVSTVIEYYKSSRTLTWLTEKYNYPVTDVKVARGNEVPNLENIIVKGYNYFPRFILRYALGFVGNKKYSNFKEFITELEKDVEQRLYYIYKSKCSLKDGSMVDGEQLFYTSSSYESYRKALIGAFINTALILNGSSDDLFANTQFRIVSVNPHLQSASEYISGDAAHHVGLANVASVKFLQTKEEAYNRSILDIIVIADLVGFSNQITWAYKVLGKVYSTGQIPSVTEKGENAGVIIGQQMDGTLIKFSLGGEEAFASSIYAGSRSGKGVMTLSILGAVLASKIGVIYLDFKPDMAECFWQYERANPDLHTYAIDMQPTSNRYGYTAKEQLRKQSKKIAKSNALCSALLILKNIQVLNIYSEFLKEKGGLTHLWVFDEINNMMSALHSGYENLEKFIKEAEPGKKEEPSDEYLYLKQIKTFWSSLTDVISQANRATFGQSGTKFLCIGQDPGEILGNGQNEGTKVLKYIASMPCNKYMLGRDMKKIMGVGTKAFHNSKSVSEKEKSLLEDCRYFVMRKMATVNAGEESTDILFKPLLTLNSSDVLHKSWRGGVGKQFGYVDRLIPGTAEYNEMLINYKKNLNSAYSEYVGPISESVLNDPEEGNGVVDEGTGFPGLLKLYFSSVGDEVSRKRAVDVAVSTGYASVLSAFASLGVVGKNSPLGYTTLEDFIYDFSEQGISFTTLEEVKELVAKGSQEQDLLEGDDDTYTEDEINALLESNPNSLDEMDNRELDDVYNSLGEEPITEEEAVYEQDLDLNYADDSILKQENIETVVNIENNFKPQTKQSFDTVKVKASPAVKLKQAPPQSVTYIDEEGKAVVDELCYVNVMKEALEGLDYLYRKHSSIGFIDKALVARNIKNRYKALIKSVKETVGWTYVDYIVMTCSEFKINDEPSINAKEYGSNGFDLYYTMDFADLLLNRAIRLKGLYLDEEVFNLIVEECGGDFFELLFNQKPNLQIISVDNIKITRRNRKKSVQIAFEERVKRAELKGRAKEELVDEFFASGKVKKTPENIAIARRMTKKTTKKKLKGLLAAQRIAQMTPMQALTGVIASGFLYVGNLIRKAKF